MTRLWLRLTGRKGSRGGRGGVTERRGDESRLVPVFPLCFRRVGFNDSIPAVSVDDLRRSSDFGDSSFGVAKRLSSEWSTPALGMENLDIGAGGDRDRKSSAEMADVEALRSKVGVSLPNVVREGFLNEGALASSRRTGRGPGWLCGERRDEGIVCWRRFGEEEAWWVRDGLSNPGDWKSWGVDSVVKEGTMGIEIDREGGLGGERSCEGEGNEDPLNVRIVSLRFWSSEYESGYGSGSIGGRGSGEDIGVI